MPTAGMPAKLPASRMAARCVLTKGKPLAPMSALPECFYAPSPGEPTSQAKLKIGWIEILEKTGVRHGIIDCPEDVSYAADRSTGGWPSSPRGFGG